MEHANINVQRLNKIVERNSPYSIVVDFNHLRAGQIVKVNRERERVSTAVVPISLSCINSLFPNHAFSHEKINVVCLSDLFNFKIFV